MYSIFDFYMVLDHDICHASVKDKPFDIVRRYPPFLRVVPARDLGGWRARGLIVVVRTQPTGSVSIHNV